jgi:hypothetical protein
VFVCSVAYPRGLVCGLNVDTFRDADLDYLIYVYRDHVVVNGDAAFDTGAFIKQHPWTARWLWPKPRGWSHAELGLRCQGAIRRGAAAVLCGRADGTGYLVGITRRTVFVQLNRTVVWSRAQPY